MVPEWVSNSFQVVMAELRTGVDALIAAREVLLRGLPGEALYGNIPKIGLLKGFTPRC